MESLIIGRRVVMHRWRDQEDDAMDESPRCGTVLAVNFVDGPDQDGDLDGDYLLLVEFDDGGLGTVMVPPATNELNRGHLCFLTRSPT